MEVGRIFQVRQISHDTGLTTMKMTAVYRRFGPPPVYTCTAPELCLHSLPTQSHGNGDEHRSQSCEKVLLTMSD